VSVVAIGVLPIIDRVGFFVAQGGQLVFANRILSAGRPVAHVYLSGDDISDQSVAVLADQRDVPVDLIP
jgi:hypothetical protein